jgi:vacuolar-type H+-ATPase subunit H
MTEESTMDQAKDQAREVAQSAGEQAGEVRDSVVEQASHVADEVKTQGREVLERTKVQVRRQGEAQAQQVAGSLRKLSEQAQALADGRAEEAGPVLDYVRQASARLQGMASRVEERGAQGLLQDLEDFGRRRPGTFLAGAALAGFVVGRVVRSASAGSPSTPRLSSSSPASPTRESAPPALSASPAPTPMRADVPYLREGA